MTDGKLSEPRPAVANSLPTWKKALFSLIAIGLFFALVELVLLIAGVKPLLYADDPYVGFAAEVPRYVEQGDSMVTAPNKIKWFNEQTFPHHKPENTVRIFCVGGSTTYGRPYRDATSYCGWLRQYLPVADASRRWEVINAGGISYASYRIAALMEQLAEFQPDLFIIYSGHNEFLERRTYGDIMEMPAAVRGLQAKLSRSRTYSLLSRVIRGEKKNGASEIGAEVNTILDDSVGPEDYSRDEEWAEQVMAHYRYNLARMVDIARAAGAKVLFVNPAANLRNSSPFKSENHAGLAGADLAAWKMSFDEAHAAFRRTDYQQAKTSIDKAMALDSKHADTLYLRGRILEQLGEHAEAKAAYGSALENDVCPLRMLPAMHDILRDVAADRVVPIVDFQALVESGADNGIPGEDEFLDHVHPTIESHQKLAGALLGALAEQGIAASAASLDSSGLDAIHAGVMATIDDHERGIALRNLANVLQWAGKYEDAYGAAKRALELTPGDAYANFVAGDLAEKLGKKEEAMRQYQFLTGFDLDPAEAPYYIEAHYKYARLLDEKGERGQSVRLLEKVLELNPDHAAAGEALPIALDALAKRLLQNGQGSQAIAPLRKLLRMRPADLNAHNLLGIASIQAGQPAEAIPHLRRVIDANPNDAGAHNNIATAYAQLGDKRLAEAHFAETVRLSPSHLGAIVNLGELYLDSGKLAQAQVQFEKALSLRPDHQLAKTRLAQIRERQN